MHSVSWTAVCLTWVMAYTAWIATVTVVLAAVKVSKIFFVLLPPVVGLAALWTAAALGYGP